MHRPKKIPVGAMLAVAMPLWTLNAHGAEPATPAEVWRTECSGCHIAYSPRLLPAVAWREVLRTLDKHFGVDATLDASVASQIAKYLEANAGRDRDGAPITAAPRITEQRWFKREHAEVAQYFGVGKKVASPADCAACHTGADQGRFNEHDIRLPK